MFNGGTIMKIEKANINDLISPDYNPRDISPEALESLKKSIEEFGCILGKLSCC